MNWSTLLNEYFSFTRKERIGLIVIVIIIIGIWIFPKIAASAKHRAVSADTSWMAAAKQLQHDQENSENVLKSNDENINDLVYDKPADNFHKSIVKLFYFDPNTLSIEGWKKLGIREKTIATIQKYLNRGGHFYNSEDLKKIYGIRSDEYGRLEPFIRIETINKKDVNAYSKNEFKKEAAPNKTLKYPLVDINVADTSEFIALPGIGNKLAARIVNFRDRLGGFYSIDQIGETYGLPDSTFQKIKPYLKLYGSPVKKININAATKDEMKSHPYMKWNLANAIVEYRNQHGNFTSVDDLKKISLITEDIFSKLKPYLLVE
jgi:competence protein ComEA